MSRDAVPRLRVFAGPNGSGKSTINTHLSPDKIGVYVNADDLEKNVRKMGYVDFADFQVLAEAPSLFAFLQASTLLQHAGLLPEVANLHLQSNRLHFGTVQVNSYLASVLVDFIRHQLLAAGISFTFETVMSSADKVAFLEKAQTAGFRTYLYYVATEDPLINVGRVRNRVAKGGHPVPAEKIISRYHRSLALLPNAIKYTNRAYLFDNSRRTTLWIAEITNGEDVEIKHTDLPHWFEKAFLDKINPIENHHVIND